MNDTKFRIGEYSFDTRSGKGIFRYAINKKSEVFSFEDTITFPLPIAIPAENGTAKPILDALAILFGISYWKLFAPEIIELPEIALSAGQADFWNTVYTIGLGEFYYKNGLDFRKKHFFEPTAKSHTRLSSLPQKNRSLLLVGGGKDSIVSGELLRGQKEPFDAFIVNPTQIQLNATKALGAQVITVEHRIDPQLFELNKRPDALNGHVPVSLMYGFLATLAAALYDYRFIIASNESSSDYGNVAYLGEIINHQWAKTTEAEKLIRNYIKMFITPDITYFSLLRPFSEIEIAERFARYPKYFELFSSCNRNFKLKPENQTAKGLWCNSCAKCAFVFALLSGFLPKKTVIKIFGENLFEKKSLLVFYRELLGIDPIKPFECVGTPEETQCAFALAHARSVYDKTGAMRLFLNHFRSLIPSLLEKKRRRASADLIPDQFKKIFEIA